MISSKFIAKATPRNISKLDDKRLMKLNETLFFANALSTTEDRKKIESVQNTVHNEMYKRGLDDVVQPKQRG
tara:strand:- start:776 stop:991 length:216 start_codon:yes stop_codon:yes gene_type:complete